jgi:hypothetical protein
MNSEQEKQLLDYFDSLGFQGEPLSKEIHDKQLKGFPYFKTGYEAFYGEEKMPDVVLCAARAIFTRS